VYSQILANKTIPTLNQGVAGGQKYLVNGIYFKLCYNDHMKLMRAVPGYTDDSEINDASTYYPPDDHELTSKIAGHELKALNAIFQTWPSQAICLPMMAIIDYRGYRLIGTLPTLLTLLSSYGPSPH
jgi:hypothetical protein